MAHSETVQPTEIIKPMIDAALKAAHVALLRRKEGLIKATKPDHSTVTNGDLQAEQIIRAVLEKVSPEIEKKLGIEKIGFLTEENLDGNQKRELENRHQGVRWVIDPIDGTRGYAQQDGGHASPWAISIALEQDGKTIAAATYEAAPNEYEATMAARQSITPEFPKGRIFWADKNVPHAHMLENGLIIKRVNEELYSQTRTEEHGDLTLLNNPHGLSGALQPHCELATCSTLSAKTSLAVNAPAELTNLPADGKLHEKGPHKAQIIAKCAEHNIKDLPNYSAVASAMHTATGQMAVATSTGYAWDHSAARFILEKSATPYIEYTIGNGKSLLVSGRHAELYADVKDTIKNMRTRNGQPTADRTGRQIALGVMGSYPQPSLRDHIARVLAPVRTPQHR